MFSVIAVIGKNGELGTRGGLIWQLPEDMRYFKETTQGHPVIMGDKTLLSLPGLLPGRKHYVLTRDKEALRPELRKMRRKFPGEAPEVEIIADLSKFIRDHIDTPEEMFVCGGGQVYKSFLPFSKKLYLTEVHRSYEEADTFFPDFDPRIYRRTQVKRGIQDDLVYDFAIYIKK